MEPPSIKSVLETLGTCRGYLEGASFGVDLHDRLKNTPYSDHTAEGIAERLNKFTELQKLIRSQAVKAGLALPLATVEELVCAMASALQTAKKQLLEHSTNAAWAEIAKECEKKTASSGRGVSIDWARIDAAATYVSIDKNGTVVGWSSEPTLVDGIYLWGRKVYSVGHAVMFGRDRPVNEALPNSGSTRYWFFNYDGKPRLAFR